MTNWPWPLDGVQSWFEELWNKVIGIATQVWQVVPEWVRFPLEKLRQFFSAAWGTFYSFFTQIAEYIVWIRDQVWAWARDYYLGILTLLYNIFVGIKSNVIAFFKDPVGYLKGGWDYVVGRVNDAIGQVLNALNSFFSPIKDAMFSFFRDPIGTISRAVSPIVSTIVDAFGRAVKVIADPIEDAVRGIGTFVASGLQEVVKWLVGSLRWLGEQIVSVTMGAVSWFKDSFIGFVTDAINRVRDALLPHSPPKEFEESITGLFEDYRRKVEEILAQYAKSPIRMEDALRAATGIAGVAATTAILAHILGAAGDFIHPTKQIGIREIIATMISYFGIDRVISPPIVMPYEVGVVIPLRQWYQSVYRPTLPNLSDLLKFYQLGVIDKATFKSIGAYLGYRDEYLDSYIESARTLLTPDKVAKLYVTEFISKDDAVKYLSMYKFDEKDKELLLASAFSFPGLDDLKHFLWRGFLDESSFKEHLKYLGIPSQYRDWYLELTKIIPGVRDLITFVVREVITPDDFYKWSAMQGLSEYWAKAYWESHWVLPSAERLFSAYLRGIIDEDEYKKYIVWHDYKPEPRPGIKVSDVDIIYGTQFDLPGRIDLRWMWEWGIISDEEFMDLLKKTGYDPKYVEKIAEAWKGNLLREERGKVLSALTEQYVSGYITEDEFRSRLKELGIIEERAKHYIDAAKISLDKDVKDEVVKTWVDMYVKGRIDKTELISELDKVIKNTAVRDAIVSRADARKRVEEEVRKREVKLTATQILRAYQELIITADRCRELLRKLDYNDEEIDILMALYAPKAAM